MDRPTVRLSRCSYVEVTSAFGRFFFVGAHEGSAAWVDTMSLPTTTITTNTHTHRFDQKFTCGCFVSSFWYILH
eukprot:m.86422 g.86422  ORF g.86422 m.86422 type:complete len:74 (-) comp9665_c0_seq1:125-346(-)